MCVSAYRFRLISSLFLFPKTIKYKVDGSNMTELLTGKLPIGQPILIQTSPAFFFPLKNEHFTCTKLFNVILGR